MVDLIYEKHQWRRYKQIKKIVISMFTVMILFLTEYSYSSEFFRLGEKNYELNEIDIGSKFGCKPGQYVGVVIRTSSDQKIVWYSDSPEEAKNIWFTWISVWQRLFWMAGALVYTSNSGVCIFDRK